MAEDNEPEITWSALADGNLHVTVRRGEHTVTASGEDPDELKRRALDALERIESIS